jgi:hypothetical protein
MVYMAGYNYDKGWTPCYWMNNNKFALSTPNNRYSMVARSIFVDDRNVYCCGDYIGKILYWINGNFFEIETLSTNLYRADEIIVSAGKIFILGSFHNRTEGGASTPCYWEDGILELLPRGSNPIVHNGKVYVFNAGGVAIGGEIINARYFVNGEEFPIGLAEVNVYANSMFIYNDDVYITGSYGDFLKRSYCYWINGTKKVDMDYYVKDIFIDQKF